MVAYKQLQKRFASMVRRSIYRCSIPNNLNVKELCFKR